MDVLFPFADLSQVKLRPALIVQSDALANNSDVIVACITSNLNRIGPARVPLRLTDAHGTATRLKTDSVVLTDKLATIDRKAIRSTRGIFLRMDLIENALRNALAL